MKMEVSSKAKFRLELNGAELNFLRDKLEGSRYALDILNRCVVRERVRKSNSTELLSDSNMKRFLGSDADYMVVYNLDASKWNKHVVAGQKIPEQSSDANVAELARQKFNKCLAPDFELVAFVTMRADMVYNGMDIGSIKNPIANEDSAVVVGNVLCRDLNTKKIVPMAARWAIVAEFAKKSDALNGPGWFVAQMNSNDPAMRTRVLNNFLVSRQK